MTPSFRSVLAIVLAMTIPLVNAIAQKPSAPKPAAPTRSLSYPAIARQVFDLHADPSRVATVSNVTLVRDVGRFQLESGRIYLCAPVGGRTLGAVFVGAGTFTFTPSTDVERQQLNRFYETTTVTEPFTSLVMLAGDSTIQELERVATFSAGEVPPSVGKAIGQLLESFCDRDAVYIPSELAGTLLNEERNELFLSAIDGGPKGPLYFEINPDEAEEVMLFRRSRAKLGDKGVDLVNAFHRQEEYSGPIDPAQDKADLKIERYTIDCTIDESMDMTTRADLSFVQRSARLTWTSFQLYPDLHVDSLHWGDGLHADHYQNGAGEIWVRIDSARAASGPMTLRMYYHGNMIKKDYGWTYLQSSLLWYPHHGYLNRALFDLTFHTPSRFLFASVGSKQTQEENDGTVVSHWRTEKPIRNASFNIGDFNQYEFKNDSIPPVTVMISKSGHSEIAGAMIEQGETSGADMERVVAEDVASSIALFQYLYGPCPVDHLYATEIPWSHGEAFPGLIHLWWKTFQKTERSGFDEFFRAHEVSHQWWGIGLDFKSYHDQWLSEGFATYSGLMFVQAVRKDNAAFLRLLEEYRDAILKNRKSIFGSGQEAGPIWLGGRTSTSTTSGDYDLIIYKKGAWVLHMLRNMMIDPNTLKEDKFRAMMREFYGSYAGQSASTEDFQRVVEKHSGAKMDWFFKQWVYGTAIPTFRCSYNLSQTADGKYLLRCRVDQENVPADFRSYMMLRLDFNGGKLLRGRRPIQGPRTEFELLLPEKPTDVVFNDLESVLCDLDNVGWE